MPTRNAERNFFLNASTVQGIQSEYFIHEILIRVDKRVIIFCVCFKYTLEFNFAKHILLPHKAAFKSLQILAETEI